MPPLRRAPLLALLLLSLAAHGPAAPSVNHRPSLDDLAWWSGTWAGRLHGMAMEEHWTTPHGGLMVGMHRDVSTQDRASFAYLRVEQRDAGLVLVQAENGGAEVEYPLISIAQGVATFESASEAWPHRILYWRDESGAMATRREGVAADGTARAEEWHWPRVP